MRVDTIRYYYYRPYDYTCNVILQSDKTNKYPSNQQTEVLMFIQTNMILESEGKPFEPYKHIAIKSGHGVGKTGLLAWLIQWFMNTRPHCRVPCTAPTQPQLFDVLWSEIAKWNEALTNSVFQNFDWTQTHFYNKHNPHTWFAVARSSNKPENMQGFHADELLFVIDEGSGVAQDIMEVVQGALTNEGAWCIMTGNPTQVSGTFYDAFHKERKYWKTWTFSCVDSDLTNFDDYIERMKGKYGEDSNIYKIRVLGQFPDSADDTLIPISWAEQAATNEDVCNEGPIYIGIDVARFGDDRTEIAARRGNQVKEWKSYSKRSTMETVGNAMLIMNNYKGQHIKVRIDDTGVGGGVTDRLNELTMQDDKIEIQGVNNGSKAYNDSAFFNMGSELWWNMREHIREWNIPDDEELIGQLSTRKYSIQSDKKIWIERKKDMKQRGLESPDKADALSLAFMDETEGGVILDI